VVVLQQVLLPQQLPQSKTYVCRNTESAHEGKELGCNPIDAPLKMSTMFFCSIHMSSLEQCFIISYPAIEHCISIVDVQAIYVSAWSQRCSKRQLTFQHVVPPGVLVL